MNQDKSKWIDHVDNIIKNLITQKTIIHIKLVEATKKENFLWVAWHLQNHARRQRKYPEITANDLVRINIKPKHGITKGHDHGWSSKKYKVIRVEDNSYLLDHPTKKRFS